MPIHVPSGKTLEKQLLAGANSNPWRINSSLFSWKCGEPAKSERFIAAQSWAKPSIV